MQPVAEPNPATVHANERAAKSPHPASPGRDRPELEDIFGPPIPALRRTCNRNRKAHLPARRFGEYTQRAAGVAPTARLPRTRETPCFLTRIRPAAPLSSLPRASYSPAPAARMTRTSRRPRLRSRPNDRDRTIRKELEAKLAGRTPEEVRGVLDQLAQEWAVRKGGVRSGSPPLHRTSGRTPEGPSAVERLKQADMRRFRPSSAPRTSESAIKVAQQLADAHADPRASTSKRSKTASRRASRRRGTSSTRAAGAADDHLFKMQTAAALAKGVPADKLPPAFGRDGNSTTPRSD